MHWFWLWKNIKIFVSKNIFALENALPTHVYTLSDSNFSGESFKRTLRSNRAREHAQNDDLSLSTSHSHELMQGYTEQLTYCTACMLYRLACYSPTSTREAWRLMCVCARILGSERLTQRAKKNTQHRHEGVSWRDLSGRSRELSFSLISLTEPP